MVTVSSHGGFCCGVRHFHSFGGSAAEVRQDIRRRLRDFNYRPEGRAVEVVLTDTQARRYGDSLAAEGFIPVFRFRNSNTGHDLTVFFYHEKPISLETLPFSFEPEKAPDISNARALVRGDRVRVVSARAASYREIGTVTSVFFDGKVRVKFNNPFLSRKPVVLSRSSVEIVQ